MITPRPGLDDEIITAHVMRHTFATTVVRGGTDLIIVAEPESRPSGDDPDYSRPSAEDRMKALDLLAVVDE